MEKINIKVVVATTLLLLLSSMAGWLVLKNLSAGMQTDVEWWTCREGRGGADCVQKQVQLFHDIDYLESKDLAKSFLTLLVAVFVGSITFSEKIIDLKTAGKTARTAMLMCWLLLLLAIVASGTGLCYISFALMHATYHRTAPYALENESGMMFFVSGAAFVFALIAMFIAALPFLFPRDTALITLASGKEGDANMPAPTVDTASS